MAKNETGHKLTLRAIPLRPSTCYAPGTPEEYIQANIDYQVDNFVRTSLHSAFDKNLDLDLILANDGDGWSSTATDGGGLSQGDPTTLTWSMLPDGVSIPNAINGEATSNSTLQSYLDSIYGSSATWLPIFQQMFSRWQELTGITYVYEPSDDGAVFPNSSGQIGVRGDVRIGGHPIDGNFNILAYNYFPNGGDMVIDAPDSFFNDTSNNSLRLRNLLAHEHGHGIGLNHTCPANSTKLMEPFLSTAFDGPQHDDIYDANRAYGDANESNDSGLEAKILNGLETNLSVDDVADEDYFAIDVILPSLVSATLTPTGSTYLKGPQNGGSCTAGVNFNSLEQQDLTIELLDQDAITVLVAADANGVGLGEAITNELIDATPGTYYLRVTGAPLAVTQLYSLQATLTLVGGACGDDVVVIDGLEVLNGENYSCTANIMLVIKNATFRSGSTGNLTAPNIEISDNVTVEINVTLDAGTGP